MQGGSDGGNSGYITDKEARVGSAALVLTGGIVVTVVTCGTGTGAYATAFGIISGSLATSSGTVKLALAFKDDEKSIEAFNKLPDGVIDAYVGLTLEAMVDGKVEKKQVRFLTQVADGAIDLKSIFQKVQHMPEYADKAVTIANVTITIPQLYKDAVEISQEPQK